MGRVVVEGDSQGAHLWVERWGEDVVVGVRGMRGGRMNERMVDIPLVTTRLERLREVLDEIGDKGGKEGGEGV